MNSTIYKEINSETAKKFTEIMLQPESFFFGRIGGLEFEVVMRYFNNITHPQNLYEDYIQQICHTCGYFDFTNYKLQNFMVFCQDMIRYYKDAKYLSYGNAITINEINYNQIYPEHKAFYNYVCENKTLFIYTFIEAVTDFMNSFKTWGEGKKILIISPLSKSINYQLTRKDKILKNYTFPNCEFKTYNTKITYNNTLIDTKETLRVTTNSFLEEIELIKNNIKNIDFDIAFIACAAYTMPLGDYISKTMQKKAIYIGGILNMFFSIYGERFKGMYPYISNIKYLIDPIENDDITHLMSGRKYKNEALNAYFGKQG
jgi:hypothetical protein